MLWGNGPKFLRHILESLKSPTEFNSRIIEWIPDRERAVSVLLSHQKEEGSTHWHLFGIVELLKKGQEAGSPVWLCYKLFSPIISLDRQKGFIFWLVVEVTTYGLLEKAAEAIGCHFFTRLLTSPLRRGTNVWRPLNGFLSTWGVFFCSLHSTTHNLSHWAKAVRAAQEEKEEKD